MSTSAICDLDTDISHTERSVHGTPLERPSRSMAIPGAFAGAVNTDARHATFNDVSGDQHITYTNDTSVETILAALKPVDHGGYYVPHCMKGTREGIFKEVDQWLDDTNAPNILWLSGSPGAGKSAIAASLVTRFAERNRPCSNFFFRQGDVTLSDPAALWRTVAHRLARSNDSFAKVLVQGLKKVDLARPDIDLHFKFLIAEPLPKCYDDALSHSIPVILIDALDECGSDRSQEPQRKAVLDTLVQWSRLRRDFKLIVTGRDERVTESFRGACYRIVLPSGGDVNEDANSDIRRFFEKRFAELGGSSFPKWPGETILCALTERAAGLFIWGETAMSFIEQDLHDEQLELVLSGDLGEDDNITKLYKQVLERSFQGVKDRTLEFSKLAISAIVLAKTPFHRDDLHQFLSVTQISIDFILKKLSSVISIGGTDERIRIGHLSFSEFLCDHKRCPKEFFIDRVEQSQNLAMTCFQKMKDGLRFNICRLETSYSLNSEVKDLTERIKTNIPGPLVYSCLFWAAHLRDTMSRQDGHNALLLEVEGFLYNRFLFWLEVMSVMEEVSAANIALLTVIPWIQGSDANLSTFARDASRFILNFDVPISTSVPHIYLSALPFSPSECLVAKQYQSQFPNTLSILSGGDAAWPAAINILRGHAEKVASVSFSPDGKRIVSGSFDKTICIWDAETAQTAAGPFEGHTAWVSSVAFSPDGNRVVSGSYDKTIWIWDAETGQTVAGPFEGHADPVRSVSFSPDGKRVVSGSSDNTIRIWDADTGQTVTGPFERHASSVLSVAFSPDGKRVVSGSSDKTIRIWDVETGQTVAGPFEGHTGGILSVTFSLDGKGVVSSSSDKTIRIWDVETGQTVAGPFEGHTGGVLSVTFSLDGKRVVSGSRDNTIRIWDAETGQTVTGTFKGHTDWVCSVAFSPDGKRVVSGSSDKTIRIWDAETGQTVTGPFERHASSVLSVAFSPDGKRVVSGSSDKTIRIWDVETGQTVAGPFEGHTGGILSVTFSPDGKRVVSGSRDKTIQIWDAETGQTVAGAFKGHTGGVLSVALSPDGNRVVSGSRDNTIRIWDVETGQTVTGPFEGHASPVFSVTFSPDGKWVVSGSFDKTIRIWDAETGQTIPGGPGPFEGHTGGVYSVAFSSDGKRVVSGSFDNTIRIWDAETGQTVAGPFKDHASSVSSVAFSPDGKRVVSGSSDETIRIWDAETGQTILGPFEDHIGGVYSVAFSPDGKRVVSGSFDHTIRIWDVETGQIVPPSFEGSTGTPSEVTLSSDIKQDIPNSLDPIICPGDVERSQISMRHVATFQSLGARMGRFRTWCDPNGWIRALHLDLTVYRYQHLLWVPEAYRESLCDFRTVLIIGKRMTRVDLSQFVHGTSWTQCYSPPTEISRVPPAPIEVTSSVPPPPAHAELTDQPNMSDNTTAHNAPSGASLCPSMGAGSHPLSHRPGLLSESDSHSPSDISTSNHSPPATSRHVEPDKELPDRLVSKSYARHLRDIAFVIVPLLAVYYFHVVRNK